MGVPFSILLFILFKCNKLYFLTKKIITIYYHIYSYFKCNFVAYLLGIKVAAYFATALLDKCVGQDGKTPKRL